MRIPPKRNSLKAIPPQVEKKTKGNKLQNTCHTAMIRERERKKREKGKDENACGALDDGVFYAVLFSSLRKSEAAARNPNRQNIKSSWPYILGRVVKVSFFT